MIDPTEPVDRDVLDRLRRGEELHQIAATPEPRRVRYEALDEDEAAEALAAMVRAAPPTAGQAVDFLNDAGVILCREAPTPTTTPEV